MHWLLLLLLLGGIGPSKAFAQPGPELSIDLPARPALEGPLVSGLRMLADARQRDLLLSGFPVRLHYRVELWSIGGWINNSEGAAEWDVVVNYDPLEKRFEVARIVNERVTLLGQHSSIESAQQAVERPFRPFVRAPLRGRTYYYNARLSVETLSVSDLDEVQRWLRGELRPAVRGERNPGTALGRGLRTLFARLVGGEVRQFDARSARFHVR